MYIGMFSVSVVLDVLFPIKLQYFFMVAHSDLKAKLKKKIFRKARECAWTTAAKKRNGQQSHQAHNVFTY